MTSSRQASGAAHKEWMWTWRHRSTVENGQVGLPWTDRVAILLCHHACDLREVPEIVRDPGRQEFLQRNRAERGMFSGELELGEGEVQSAQLAEILLSQATELREQVTERATLVAADMAEAVE
jgi:hypothetical protein